MKEETPNPNLIETAETHNKSYAKYLKIILPVLFILAAALGIYQWQFGTETNQTNPIDTLYKGVSDGSLEDYYNFGQSQKGTDTTEVNFYAVGDIMLSRNVAGQISKNQKDSYWPFRNLETELRSTDFNFGNLESPFSGRDDFNATGSLVFNAPTWTMPGLVQHNFKVLNLANNHAYDQGKDALLYTKNLLKENGLLGLGVGNNLDEAFEGQVYSVKGMRIGFIGASYASENDGGVVKNDQVARIEDVERFKKSIADLKTRSDFVVVTMHAGTEYTREPNQSQIDFAHAAIDAGADLIIGAHPHWIQTTEQYKGKYIFYSLGNFVFDQMWSQETKQGLMLKISVSKNGSCAPNPSVSPSGQQQVSCSDSLQGNPIATSLKQIELVPVIIENYGQPRIANETEKQNILKKIGVITAIITPIN